MTCNRNIKQRNEHIMKLTREQRANIAHMIINRMYDDYTNVVDAIYREYRDIIDVSQRRENVDDIRHDEIDDVISSMLNVLKFDM